MTSPFGKNCPWKGCQKKIVRATGDTEGTAFSARCEGAHRSAATRDKNGRLSLKPDPDEASLGRGEET